jgi:hypothetical protein
LRILNDKPVCADSLKALRLWIRWVCLESALGDNLGTFFVALLKC